MDANVKKMMDLHLQTCKKQLQSRGFHVAIAENLEELHAFINEQIQDGDLVCDGGSMTLKECGILDLLAKRNISFTSHNANLSKAESDAQARLAFQADVFLASANAITMDGEIINVDGHGNRVSAMIFGPKKVLLIVGTNKIVSNETAARERIETIAAVANSIRLHKETPCAYQGRCADCHSQDRICSSYVKLTYDKEDRITVVFVKGSYGY